MAMQKVVSRLWRLGTLGIAVSGCSVGYIVEHYGATGATIVTVACHSAYEVYENARDRTILVRTNIGAAVTERVCRDDLPPGAPPQARLERAVEIYFATTNRPKCRTTERRELSPIHSEFSYTCSP